MESNFITLISKVKQPSVVSQYRPNLLCSTIYKIIEKNIVARLKSYLPTNIFLNQTIFFGIRKVVDNFVLAHEFIHMFKIKRWGKKKYISVKLNIAKEYDQLE